MVSSTAKPDAVHFDASGLENHDSSLLSFLLGVHRYCQENGIAIDLSTLPNDVRALLDLALAVPEKRDAKAGV